MSICSTIGTQNENLHRLLVTALGYSQYESRVPLLATIVLEFMEII